LNQPDPVLGEAGFAVGEIEAPQPLEPFVVSELREAFPGALEVAPPATQRVGVVGR
jgi:hypothetical protein